jgi:hypothetical protein
VTPDAPDLQRRGAVAWTLVGASAVMVAYWTIWFVGDRSLLASSTRPAYLEFENAFPLADGWITVCALLGAEALWRGRPTALLWMLAGSGAGLYLAGMDVLYDLQHDIWTAGSGGAIELVINVVTVTLSVATLRWAWRRRRLLL